MKRGCSCECDYTPIEAMHCLAVLRSLNPKDAKKLEARVTAAGYNAGMAEVYSARAVLRADGMGWNPTTGRFDRKRPDMTLTGGAP